MYMYENLDDQSIHVNVEQLSDACIQYALSLKNCFCGWAQALSC